MQRKVYKKNIFILTILIIFSMHIQVLADVGSFETYDSGSDWDWDSDYSYDYDYDYYDYDYDDDYSYSNLKKKSNRIQTVEIIAFITFIIFLMIIKSSKKHTRRQPLNYYPNANRTTTQEDVEEKVKAIDELFNEEEFIAWTKDLFVKMQEAWSERDWNVIRCFETNDLFEQHQKQLQGDIDNHQINKIERVCVKSAQLFEFEQSGDKDILTVTLNSKMIDYIIDDRTQEIIKGDKTTDRHSTYKMVFVRKTGVKTKEGTNTVNITNCPNCGAPTQITSSGKCEYCGSVITTGEFSWVLANLEKIG